MTIREHPFTGKTIGTSPDTTEFSGVNGTLTSMVYVDAEAEGFGVAGEIALAFGQDSSGAGTSVQVGVNESAPGSATIGLTMAWRHMITRTPGGSHDLFAPRSSTNKIARLLQSTSRTLQPWYGGAGTSPTSTETAAASASPALTLGVPVNIVDATEVGATSGKRYVRVWLDDGTVIYESTTTNLTINAASIASANFGKYTNTAGTFIVGRIRTENAYNPALTPLAAPVVAPTTAQQFYFQDGTTRRDLFVALWDGTTKHDLGTITVDGGEPAGASPFFTDTFTDTGSVDLGAHTSDSGHTWSKHQSSTGGAMVVENGVTYCSTTAGVTYVSSAAPPSANYYAETVFAFPTVPTNQNLGISVRADPTADTQYRVRYIQSVGGFRLDRLVTGTNTVLATYPYTPTAGGTCTVRLSANGDQVQVTINGTAQAAVTDTGITGVGRPAVLGNNSSTSTTGVHLTSLTATAL